MGLPRIMPKNFNNTIKIVLLFLIWTLIWRHGGIAAAAEAHDKRMHGAHNANNSRWVGAGAVARAIYVGNYADDDADGAAADKPKGLTARSGVQGAQLYWYKDLARGEQLPAHAHAPAEGKNRNYENGQWRVDDTAYVGSKSMPPMLMKRRIIEAAATTKAIAVEAAVDIEHENENDNENENEPHTKDEETMQGIRDGSKSAFNVGDELKKNVEYEQEDVEVEKEDEDERLSVTQDMQMTAILQHQLIHNFAIKHKQIPRVTLFTCRQHTMAAEWYNSHSDSFKHNDAHASSAKTSTMGILKRLFMSLAPSTATAETAAGSRGRSSGSGDGHGTGSVAGSGSKAGGALPKDIFIKIVQIDQLISKRRSGGDGKMFRAAAVGGLYGRGGGSRAASGQLGGGPGGAANRNSYTNANWLEQVLRSDTRRQVVVLDMSCGAASRRVIEMASSKELFSTAHHWLLIEEDYALQREAENSNAASAQDKVQEETLTVVTSGDHSRDMTKSATKSSNVAEDEESSEETIEKFLEKININIDTELILAKRMRRQVAESDPNGTLQSTDYYAYKLYDVWSPGLQYGGELNITAVGTFTLDRGFAFTPWYRLTATILRRTDMKLASLRCMIVITNKNRTDTLEHYLATHYDTHLDSMNRFNFALLTLVRDLYNFSLVVSKTPSWGYLKNGKFDGMIGALVRKQADIGGSPIFFRIERAKVIDYTARTWVAKPCFVFRHPRSTAKDRIVFLQPFSNGVWIFLGVCGVITILLLWLLTTIESKLNPDSTFGCLAKGKPVADQVRYARAAAQSRLRAVGDATSITSAAMRSAAQQQQQQQQQRNSAGTISIREVGVGHIGGGFKRCFVRWGNIFCGHDVAYGTHRRAGLFFESVLFYIGSICQQGLAYSTRFFSGRCIILTSLVFSFSIYQFYSASIVGTLLMEKPKTIRTLRDLVHSTLEIGIEDIIYNRDFFLRTKDPDAIELYAKKVTAVPMNSEQGFLETPPDADAPVTEPSAAAKAKTYREILHSHETGAHAKTNEASNWYDPEFGVAKVKKGRFAFHVDVATAYKIISDTFTEKEICDLTEIPLFPTQKAITIVQKGSPLRKIVTYGLRRVTEVGLMDYERKIWHSPKPRCVKQMHTDDLRVGMETFTSAFLVLLFGFGVSLLALGLEIMHHKLQLRFTAA